MLNVLTIAVLFLGAILLAKITTSTDSGDLPSESGAGLQGIFAEPLLVLFLIAAMCLALGPGPPVSEAGSLGVSRTNVSTDNGASVMHLPFNPGP
ncbi:MAG: hypothetical protein NTX14_02095 [Candidatus Nealsonbacteria bacterium]|nr:hypothetical protein [Candidatus Nealsonbacteria bacterium]